MKRWLSFGLALLLCLTTLSVAVAAETKLTNLFDAKNVTTPAINYENGVYSENVMGFMVSDYIAVSAGDTIYMAGARAGQGWHAVVFDSSKQAIARIGNSDHNMREVESLEDTLTIFAFEVPEKGAYARFITEPALLEKYLVTRNQEVTKASYYAFFNQEEPTVPSNPVTDFDVDPNSPMIGASALFIGDSICYGQWDDASNRRGYALRIGEAYSMKTVVNTGIGGTTMAEGVREYLFSPPERARILYQLNEAAKEYRSFDYVILQGGVNDAWGHHETGENYALPGEVSESFDPKDFDLTTFAGGLEELIYNALKIYPKAKVGYIINFDTSRLPSTGFGQAHALAPYVNVALKICDKWNVPYLNLFYDNYVNKTLLAPQYMQDPVHPNKAGYDRLAPYIAKWMETMPTNEELKNDPLQGKSALFVGDSIAYGHNDSPQGRGWAGRIGDDHNMQADNKAVSGWTISTCRGANSRVLFQLNGVKDNLYDYVVLHGGVNDAWERCPLGTPTTSYSGSFDSSTFAGALEQTIKAAYQYFPSARLGFIMNFKLPNGNNGKDDALHDMSAYAEMAEAVCKKWGVSFLDLYNDEYVNKELLDVYNIESAYLPDTVHPNKAGYDRLSPYIAEWMQTMQRNDLTAAEELYSRRGRSMNDTEALIDAIGDITPENYQEKEEALKAAEAAYAAVGSDYGVYWQKKIDNADVLTAARAAYDEAAGTKQPDDPTPPQGMYGDLNGDKAVNAADALAILRAAVGKATLTDEQKRLADVNVDGAVNAADALLVLRRAVYPNEQFPVEKGADGKGEG